MLAVLLALLLTVPLVAVSPPSPVVSLHVRIPMRDRILLCANIFRPAGVGRGPVLLVRTPYGKSETLSPNYRFFVGHGYAVVVQNVRGRYDSQGKFRPAEQETPDGEDTLNWIGRQRWCDGNIGMMGGSYLGIAQWRAALGYSRYLKAIFPVVSGSDEYFDRFYSRGGALKLGHRLQWIAENMKVPKRAVPAFSVIVNHLPLRATDITAAGRSVDFYQQALNHPAYDNYWKELSTLRSLGRVRVPAFIVGGWYDNFVESDLAAFEALQARFPENRLLIGPWPHNMSLRFPDVDFGSDSMVPVRSLQLEWFDRWLRGSHLRSPRAAPVRVFVMGENRWRELPRWPPADTSSVPFYLGSSGHANTLEGDGQLRHTHCPREGRDDFIYNPRDPVPTRGGSVCCNPKVFPWGPVDQRPVERREDVLVYTTPPLRDDVTVLGTVKVVLYVSTSAPDTDFTAKLVDVFPGGMARNLTDGILRMRYQTSLETPAKVTPGRVYAITINAGVTANTFLAGHRIRLEISSSNFPRFDRNPNTGRPVANETELRIAKQSIWHGPQQPSHLLLPVVPTDINAKLTSHSARRYSK